jgi:hypothetical protein
MAAFVSRLSSNKETATNWPSDSNLQACIAACGTPHHTQPGNVSSHSMASRKSVTFSSDCQHQQYQHVVAPNNTVRSAVQFTSCCQPKFVAHLASYTMGIGSFPWGNAAGPWLWPSILHPAPRSKKEQSYTCTLCVCVFSWPVLPYWRQFPSNEATGAGCGPLTSI